LTFVFFLVSDFGFTMLLAAQNLLWYLLPLALAVSLVYSASRFELPERIVHRATRLFLQIMLFMGTIFAILFVLSDGL
jgi:hypothetical protein